MKELPGLKGYASYNIISEWVRMVALLNECSFSAWMFVQEAAFKSLDFTVITEAVSSVETRCYISW